MSYAISTRESAPWETKGLLIGGLAGILGVIVGAVSTGVVNYVTLEKQQRERAVLDSFRFDQGGLSEGVHGRKDFRG